MTILFISHLYYSHLGEMCDIQKVLRPQRGVNCRYRRTQPLRCHWCRYQIPPPLIFFIILSDLQDSKFRVMPHGIQTAGREGDIHRGYRRRKTFAGHRYRLSPYSAPLLDNVFKFSVIGLFPVFGNRLVTEVVFLVNIILQDIHKHLLQLHLLREPVIEAHILPD